MTPILCRISKPSLDPPTGLEATSHEALRRLAELGCAAGRGRLPGASDDGSRKEVGVWGLEVLGGLGFRVVISGCRVT